eukprot:scaffold1439_cov179-Ochromonas_danica.AAC.6
MKIKGHEHLLSALPARNDGERSSTSVRLERERGGVVIAKSTSSKLSGFLLTHPHTAPSSRSHTNTKHTLSRLCSGSEGQFHLSNIKKNIAYPIKTFHCNEINREDTAKIIQILGERMNGRFH